MAADELAVGIELLRPHHGVEGLPLNPLAAQTGCQLPVAAVGGGFEIQQLAGKPIGAILPAATQHTAEKSSAEPAQTVRQPAGVAQEAHGGIGQRVAGYALLPSGQQRLVGLPGCGAVFEQALLQHIGILAEIMPPKFAPRQSFVPGSGIGRIASGRPRPAHRQRAEHQMRRKLRAAVLGGQAVQHGVIRQARQKLGQLPPGGGFAAGNGEHGAGDGRQRGGFQIFR